MIVSPAGRCWARAFGIAVGVVATVGAGVVAIAVSEVGWHVALTAVLLMACAAGGVALVVGNLVLARPDPRRARGILRWGTGTVVVVVLGLLGVGLAVLLVGADGSDAWFTTWVAAAPAASVLLLGSLSGREARDLPR